MIKIDVDTREAGTRIKNLTRRAKRLEVPLRRFGDIKVKKVETQFDRQVDPDGNRWAELSPVTLERKERLGFSSKILTETGTLSKSFKFEATGKTLTIGSSVSYAVFHQEGTSKMPQRKILGYTKSDEADLIKILKSHFK